MLQHFLFINKLKLTKMLLQIYKLFKDKRILKNSKNKIKLLIPSLLV